MKNGKNKILEFFWPDLSSVESSAQGAKKSAYFIYFLSLLGVIVDLLAWILVTDEQRPDLFRETLNTLIIIGMGFGIQKLSRIVAVWGMALIFIIYAYQYIQLGHFNFLSFLHILVFFNGYRSVTKYHKLIEGIT